MGRYRGRGGHPVRDRLGSRDPSRIAPGQPSFRSTHASKRPRRSGDASGSHRYIDLDRDPAPLTGRDLDPNLLRDRRGPDAPAPNPGKAPRRTRKATERRSDRRLHSAVHDRREGTRSLQVGLRELMGAGPGAASSPCPGRPILPVTKRVAKA
jgi:hypothetical protein